MAHDFGCSRRIGTGENIEPQHAKDLAGTWTANNGARSYIILGDPAVRLPLVDDGESEVRQTSVAEIEHLTGLDFGSLRERNVGTVDSFAITPDQPSERTPLSSYDQIQLTGAISTDSFAFSGLGTTVAESAGANPRERITGTDFGYYLLAFDENRRLTKPNLGGADNR